MDNFNIYFQLMIAENLSPSRKQENLRKSCFNPRKFIYMD